MSKKKKGKGKKKVSDPSHKVNRVIQQMTAPPESVMSHLKRIGIEPLIDQMQLDDGEPEVYVLFKYQELIDKELASLESGGFKPAAAPQKRQSGTAPIILEEIRKRMEEAVKRHPSYKGEEEEWPITGENPL